MKSVPHIAWIHQPSEPFPRYAIVHSSKISGAELDRAEELLAAGQATDDFTPIIFLDERLNTPELRGAIQALSLDRKPPAQ